MHRPNGGEAAVRRSADLGKLTSATELSCKQSGSEPSVRGNGGFDTDAAPSPHPRASSAQMGGGPAQIHFTIWRNTLCNFNKYKGGFETAASSLLRWGRSHHTITFGHLDKCSLQLRQINFTIWTNTFSNFNKYNGGFNTDCSRSVPPGGPLHTFAPLLHFFTSMDRSKQN